MRAYRVSTKETYEANGVERVIWAASESSATCAACWAMDGRAFDLNKLPNDHPNGRCTILTPRKLFSWGPRRLSSGRIGAPGGKFNIFRWGQGSEERFKERLTEEEQKKILGPKRWELWKEGKLKWEDIAAVKPDETYGPTLGISPLKDGKAPGLPEKQPVLGGAKIFYPRSGRTRAETYNNNANRNQPKDVTFVPSEELLAKINNGELSTKLRAQVQRRHVEGEDEFYEYLAKRGANNPQSILRIPLQEVQGVIDKYHGTGYTVYERGTYKEYVNIDRVAGRTILKNTWVSSSRIAIVYSKKGAHIYPVKDINV